MKPSIWTSLYHLMPPAEALRKLAAQGWEAFELSCEHLGLLAQAGPAAVEEYGAVIAELGVEVPQCHCTILADVAAIDPAARSRDLALVHHDLDICAKLGIRNMVIHPGGSSEAPDRATWDHVGKLRREAFCELADHGEQAGVRLAIENMTDGGRGVFGLRRFGAVVEELLELIAEVGSDHLGICLDTSHANMQGLNQPEAIRTCGAKIIALHISDNDGTADQHRTPGYGSVAWAPLIAALQEIGYPFHFNLEIPGELREDHPTPGMVDLRSTYALGVCRHLLG